MPVHLADLDVHETSGVDHPAHLRAGWLVMKNASAANVAETLATLTQEERPVPDTDATGESIDELKAQIAQLTKALEAAQAPAATETDEEALLKAAPASVRLLLEGYRDQAAQAVAKAAAAEQVARQTAEDAADRLAVAKARDDYAGIGLDPSLVGPALRRLAAADPALHKAVTQTLDATREQARQSANLFKAVGSTGAGAPVEPDSQWGRVQKAADAEIAKNPALTREQAVAQAVRANPALYTEGL